MSCRPARTASMWRNRLKNLLILKLRDTNPAFDEAKAADDLGIPCYVLEDGTVTLYSKDVGLQPRPQTDGVSCSIDGTGC